MKKEFLDSLNGLSSHELEEIRKGLTDLIKDVKATEKVEVKKMFEDTVEIGDEVAFVFKDEEIFGEVTKINKATFTAEFKYDGETVKKAIQFHKFVGKGKEEGEEAA